MVAIPIAALLTRPVARALRTTPWLAGLLRISAGVVVVATLAPIHSHLGVDPSVTRACDMSRRWFASRSDLTGVNDISLNIALFISLGVAIAWLPASRGRLAVGLAVGSVAGRLAPRSGRQTG